MDIPVWQGTGLLQLLRMPLLSFLSLEVVLPGAVWVALFVLWQREIPSI